MRFPKIAIVLPVYNAEPWVERAIHSALEQSYPPQLVVAVDDGSDDGSLERLRSFGNHIVCLTGPNRGACNARNRGLSIAAKAGADYVIFLDADDYLEGDILKGIADVVEENNPDLVISNVHLEYSGPKRIDRPLYEGAVAPEQLFSGWLEGDHVTPSGVAWSIAFITSIGGWDESVAKIQDLEITLRAMLSRPSIYKNEVGAAIYVQDNPNSITRNQSKAGVESRLKVLVDLINKTEGTEFARYRELMLRAIYFVARSAFRAGYIDLGRRAMAYLRSAGYRKHPGSRAHSIVAGIIGLETKTRLWEK